MNKKPTVIYSDEIIKIVVDEAPLILSDEENNAQQFKHDEEMAKRFGFESYSKLQEYINICQSNIDWVESNGQMGFLSNVVHIQEFNQDVNAFKMKVAEHRANTSQMSWPYDKFSFKYGHLF
jgi:hypothetical protein